MAQIARSSQRPVLATNMALPRPRRVLRSGTRPTDTPMTSKKSLLGSWRYPWSSPSCLKAPVWLRSRMIADLLDDNLANCRCMIVEHWSQLAGDSSQKLPACGVASLSHRYKQLSRWSRLPCRRTPRRTVKNAVFASPFKQGGASSVPSVSIGTIREGPANADLPTHRASARGRKGEPCARSGSVLPVLKRPLSSPSRQFECPEAGTIGLHS